MIGLLPAAGNASRIHGLPKYLLPVPGGYLLQWHIRGLMAAGCPVWIGTTAAQRPLLEPYAGGAALYTAQHHETMTQTVQSVPIRTAPVLFSMPDTYWNATRVHDRLAAPLAHGTAAVAVALFKARPGQHREGGMCQIEGERVVSVVDKPDHNGFPYIWGALAWTPRFWDYLKPEDPHVGYGLPRAIDAGLDVRAVLCEGHFWDCGTPERYFNCIRQLGEVHEPA